MWHLKRGWIKLSTTVTRNTLNQETNGHLKIMRHFSCCMLPCVFKSKGINESIRIIKLYGILTGYRHNWLEPWFLPNDCQNCCESTRYYVLIYIFLFLFHLLHTKWHQCTPKIQAFNSDNGSPMKLLEKLSGLYRWSTDMPIPTYWPSFPIFPWYQACQENKKEENYLYG